MMILKNTVLHSSNAKLYIPSFLMINKNYYQNFKLFNLNTKIKKKTRYTFNNVEFRNIIQYESKLSQAKQSKF